MQEKIIIAGAGGQGIMLMGRIIAQSAMHTVKYVTWLPTYGAEVRGGCAYCMVVVSDAQIGSPYVDKADTVIIMNQPSLAKFHLRLTRGGLLITNSSLAHATSAKPLSNHVSGAFSDIAARLGNIKTANMVALGCYLARKPIVAKADVFSVMQDLAPAGKPELVEINKRAIIVGIKVGLEKCRD
jgi:2-oxoglutarate ferredoxin oxidoreductase subunit gamma